MISVYTMAYWLKEAGYFVVGTDPRGWGDGAWVKVRTPQDQLLIYRAKRKRR